MLSLLCTPTLLLAFSIVSAWDLASYLSVEEQYLQMRLLHEQYPSWASAPESIGLSVEGRSIWSQCFSVMASSCSDVGLSSVSGGGSSHRPVRGGLLLTGMHHAREPVGTISTLAFASEVLSLLAVGDPSTVALMSSYHVRIIPTVNPDAYELNLLGLTSNRYLARKNRRPGCTNGAYEAVGVDLNRNYDFEWSRDNLGSNPDVCAEDYRGPSPASEPEVQAVVAYLSRLEAASNPVTVALNYHSFGRFINLPFAVQALGAPPLRIYDAYLHLAHRMAAVTDFSYGHPWSGGLYTVNGEASDWMLKAHGIFAMSPEVGPSMDYYPFQEGMWPKIEQLPSLVQGGMDLAREVWPLVGTKWSLSPMNHSSSGMGVSVQCNLEAAAGGSSSERFLCSLPPLSVTNEGLVGSLGDLVVSAFSVHSVFQHPSLCAIPGAVPLGDSSSSCALQWHQLVGCAWKDEQTSQLVCSQDNGSSRSSSEQEDAAMGSGGFCPPPQSSRSKNFKGSFESFAAFTSPEAGDRKGLLRQLHSQALGDTESTALLPPYTLPASEKVRMSTNAKAFAATCDARDNRDGSSSSSAADSQGPTRTSIQQDFDDALAAFRDEALSQDKASSSSAESSGGLPRMRGLKAAAPEHGENNAPPRLLQRSQDDGINETMIAGIPLQWIAIAEIASSTASTASVDSFAWMGDGASALPARFSLPLASSMTASSSFHIRLPSQSSPCPADTSPASAARLVSYVSVSDALTCSVFSISCNMTIRRIYDGATDCLACALLRSQAWQDVLTPSQDATSGRLVPLPSQQVTYAWPWVLDSHYLTPFVQMAIFGGAFLSIFVTNIVLQRAAPAVAARRLPNNV